MARVHTKQSLDFVHLSTTWLGVLFEPLWSGYRDLTGRIGDRNRFCAFICRDHLLFFLLACVGMTPFVPKYAYLLRNALEKIFTPGDITPIDTVVLPYVPPVLAAALLLFVLTYRAGRRLRNLALLAAALVLLPTHYDTDPVAVAAFMILATVWLLLIKSSLSRSLVFPLLVASALGVRALAYYSARPELSGLGRLFEVQTILIPILWYSTFAQYPPRNILKPLRFYLYQFVRFFGAPAATYDDYFRTSDADLLKVRFAGVKALYSTLIGIHVMWWINNHMMRPLEELTGFALLFHSYLKYVNVYLYFLVEVNMFIGVMRLFGFPIRDNFNRAFLARTPNEHWQRWNILLREWVVTVSFYPVMRARRGLFLAVMAAMLTSGFLHLPHIVMRPDGSLDRVGITLAYWIVNGLAIYAVLKIPRAWPKLIKRTGMAQGRAWAVFGVVATSAFYGILVGTRTTCDTWPEVLDYFRRLLLP